MTAPFGRRLARIAGRTTAGPYVVLTTDDAAQAEPGQFFMIAAAEHWGGGEDERPYLGRAFSTMAPTATFLVDDVGPGTHRLGELRTGDELWLVGPLGQPFTPPADGRRAVIVAGGVGVPPLAFLARLLPGATVLVGFRDALHAEAAELFAEPLIATDDGSLGYTGFVTDLLVEELDADDHATVYSCGPPGMLEAVREICVHRDVPAQLALEAAMACGFGACFGCVVPLRDGGYARTCVEGPVMVAEVLAEVPAH